MTKNSVLIFLLGLVVMSCTPKDAQPEWILEATNPESHFTISNDTIDMVAPTEGFTLWYNHKLEGDYTISYRARVVMEGGPYDRLSDLNCLWAMMDPENPTNLLAKAEWRNAHLYNYFIMHGYYVGFGGNDNTTTRFRKYVGSEAKPPVIQEYTDEAHLLEANRWYDIRIEMKGNWVRYYMDEECLFELDDEHAYREGYFAFRTYYSHLQVCNFRVSH